ncbi:MAG TPA: hypothetical protein DIT62_09430 [Alphaproteobacteria bacterium]|nr:hypothetical protein [Alphaproteobacteria bacterium]
MFMSHFRITSLYALLGSICVIASSAHADTSVPSIDPSMLKAPAYQSHMTLVSSASDIANSNSTINFICKRKPKPNIYKKLEKANFKKLEKSFGMSVAEIDKMLEAPARSPIPFLPSFNVIKGGFDSPEGKELFENFINNPNSEDLAIMLATSEKSSFDTKAKKRIADATFAYGIIHMMYGNQGGNIKLGEKFVKAAAKKNQYASRYIEGVFWLYGYNRNPNLTNAATWMRPSYEIAYKQKDDFSSIVSNTFYEIVFHPSYPQRDLYIDLATQAQQMRADLINQMNSGGGVNTAALFRQDVNDLSIRRVNLLIGLGNIIGMGDQVEAYQLAAQDIVNQSNMDTLLDELIVTSNAFQASVEQHLAEIDELDQEALDMLKQLHDLNGEYISDTHQLLGFYTATSMVAFMNSEGANMLNTDTLNLMYELGVMRSKACEVYNGINDYAQKVSFEIELSNPVIVEGIARPKKK